MQDQASTVRRLPFATWLESLINAARRQPGALELFVLGACGAALVLNPSVGLLMIASAAAWLWQSRAPALSTPSGPILFVAVAATYLVSVAARVPIAPDDLLRDIAVARYGFDYRLMFPLSAANLQAVSMWWGFDRVLGQLSDVIGPLGTVWTVQGALAIGFFIWVGGICARFLPADDARWYWAAVLLSLVAPLVMPRVLLGRPEIFLTLWAASAVLATTRARQWLWVGSGFALSLSYWLMPLYVVAVVLLPATVRARIVVATLLLAFHCAAWLVITNGTYFQAIYWLGQVLDSQVGPVAENSSLSTLIRLAPFAVLLIAAGFAVAGRCRQALLSFAVAAFFAASDQVRYVATVTSFLALTSVIGLSGRLPSLSSPVRAALIVFLPLLGLHLSGSSYRLADMPSFRMKTGSLTLTAFGAATYSVPFFGEGTPGVEPSFAFGAAPRSVQNLSVELSRGRIDCAQLLGWPFTHVLERTLVEVPACLSIAAVDGQWRLWTVRRPQ